MNFWDIFSPKLPPDITTGGSWRSRSVLDVLSDNKKEKSQSSHKSQSSYSYDDDDDDYDWEKEERKRIRSSLQRASKRFLQEKSIEIVGVLSKSGVCLTESYQPTLKLSQLKYGYFDLNSDYWKANIVFPYRIAKVEMKNDDINDSSVPLVMKAIEDFSKEGYESFLNTTLWFNKTYDGKLNFSQKFRADLSILVQIYNAKNEIKKALHEHV